MSLENYATHLIIVWPFQSLFESEDKGASLLTKIVVDGGSQAVEVFIGAMRATEQTDLVEKLLCQDPKYWYMFCVIYSIFPGCKIIHSFRHPDRLTVSVHAQKSHMKELTYCLIYSVSDPIHFRSSRGLPSNYECINQWWPVINWTLINQSTSVKLKWKHKLFVVSAS